MYLMIKHLHMTLALISILGFIVRGALAINQHSIMQQKWIRILPHIIDTGLIVAAIYLAWFLRLNPITQPWLAVKIVALVVYIVLGARVIKRRGSVKAQWVTYAAAIATFAYIGAVAMTRSPWII
ncbi:SirB2 family protein [Reinekea blandensis]|uniref:Invasion gene expression up-regulator, SirB n=1 Tax=Reinekea blandensis MED297 TaxID=314283 RepID=A4BIA2_9GAMM|nr:SirB2 family protein [Reinekea blandensis]EAR08109.1 hypothetical protein MED297_00435 [Reinekea sp. MED297] [Reinekea blandensis MED297]